MLHQLPKAAAPAPLATSGPSATVALSELRQASAHLGRVVLRWNLVPVQACVRVRFAEGKVTLDATDTDMALTLELDAQTTGAADLVVSHRALAGFLRAARGPVALTYLASEEHDRLRLSDGEIEVTLKLTIPPEDFPRPFDDLDQGWLTAESQFTLSGAQALRLLDLGRSCISREETRYYLNGTYLTAKPEAGTLRAVSTDGHRMAVIDCEVPAQFRAEVSEDPSGIILPVRAVDLLLALARKSSNAALQIHASDRHLVLRTEGLQLITRSIDGTYPDYTRVVPAPSDKLTAHLSTAALTRLRTIASATTSGQSLPLRLNPGAGRMSLATGEGDEISAPLQGHTTEDGLTVTISLRLLSELARIAPAFTLSCAGRGDPARIATEDPDALWVLMPMRD
ncbi:MAG: hypothetical protein GYB51_16780 [Rhodobacteraceae bacterium]|nr:hypothetical protein [Paracoccaceae bacterium]